MTLRIVVAVVVAGIAGTLANSVVVALLTPKDFVPLAISPGRNAVAIAVAIFCPVLFAMLARGPAVLALLVVLTVVPSILAKTVFGLGAPWGFVLAVNAVYAVAAVAVYAAIARPERRDA